MSVIQCLGNKKQRKKKHRKRKQFANVALNSDLICLLVLESILVLNENKKYCKYYCAYIGRER